MIWDKSLGQFNDLNGKPAHTLVSFFKTGTTEAVTVYKDPEFKSPHKYAIESDSLGRIPAVYLKPGSGILRADITTGKYKLRSIDGIDPGSVAGTSSTSVISFPTGTTQTTSSITITVDQFGSFVPIRTTSGQMVPALLPRATTVSNGPLLGVRNTGAGYVVVRTTSPDLIDGAKSKVVGPYKSLVVTPTGAEYFTFSESAPLPTHWAVKNRSTTTPPASATVGDTYLAATGATGGWTASRIYESDGSGNWTAYTPKVGDRASILNELVSVTTAGTSSVTLPLLLIYSGTEWVSETAYADARVKVAVEPLTLRVTALEAAQTPKTLKSFRALQSTSSGGTSLAAQGGTQPVAGNWTVNALTQSSGTVGTRTGNTINLPAGSYHVRASRAVKGALSAVLGLRNTSGTVLASGITRIIDANANELITLDAPFELSTATDVELIFMLSGTVGALSLGDAAALPGQAEVFAELVIESRTPS